MPYFDQAQFDVRCEWGMPGVQHLAPADVVVIVDVLSFTTCVDVALGRGATILPYRWNDSATQYARERDAELAGHRGDSSAKYSLSPASLIDAPRRLRLVLPSPNGSSLAFEAMSRGATVVAACLRNAAAVARWASANARRVNVIPAGERWPDGSLRPCVDDLLGAGAVVAALSGRRSPEAELAAAAFEMTANRVPSLLLSCESGRELDERGFARDAKVAAELNVSDVVPVLRGEAFVPAADLSTTRSD